MSTKKEDLVQSAEKLFYEHGFHSTGLKRVIKEANVAVMTLYNHFSSKDKLIVEVLKRREKRYFAQLQVQLQESSDLSSICLHLAEAHVRWLVQNETRGCLFLRAKEEYGSDSSHPIVQVVNQHKSGLLRFFQKKGLTETQAMQLTLLFEGATAMAETEDVDKIGKELIYLTQRLF
ncbi:TetR/AcrR family transcriptional regulator [Pseudogracilibacillus auburnensis]|uniref:TetR family transcriptional regulator n=1 Tax=Pseudogracilibacillus auburnensis TaxID=1494959 RepID=A0A2V3W884_9BACI|nr:TetR/AcrR family transcriptional regulator [Pseudogracilibacillus auburnensis]MBO1001125.1 TetR/AcrR family transcriptional regulator [Pseudogracilibacillus auburnensis]PXW90557.1 TetR family transcriptional regulator [Pseudogracilibacillus auburnensis]